MKSSENERRVRCRRATLRLLLGASAALVLALPGVAMGDPKATAPRHVGPGQGHQKHPGMSVPGREGWSPPAKGHAGHHMPELDPGSVGAALALLAGGTLILRDRRRRSR